MPTKNIKDALLTPTGSVTPKKIGDLLGNVEGGLEDKADIVHTHAIADVTGLQGALDGKAASDHDHVIADVTGLQTTLDGKADDVHTHAIADVTGLQTALDGKLTDAPSDGKTYARKDAAYVEVPPMVVLTQAAYDALGTKDANTFYFITE